MNNEMPIIFIYTREQAIADGVLVDVSDTSAELGFKVPVAVTAGLWAECVTVPSGITDQDEAGRLWDVLWMLKHAIRGHHGKSGSEIRYSLLVKNDPTTGPRLTELKAVLGPDENGTPTLTVMLPHED